MKIFVFVLSLFCIQSKDIASDALQFHAQIQVFIDSYPDLNFSYVYDEDKRDFIVTITFPEKKDPVIFYWCSGRMLPEDQIANKEKFWTILYDYPQELKDPALMTEAEKEALKEFTSRENRRNGAGTPPFFFDELYSAPTRKELEKNLVTIPFLGKKTTIHKRIKQNMENVNTKVLELAKTDEEVGNFVKTLKATDAYYWRKIEGTPRKSFHSYGIAIDIIPKRYTGEVFWSWARDHNPKGWMLIPLNRRWLPPLKVVKIFEQEGFIWGGKWTIWDNMHFEYHPELLNFNRIDLISEGK